MAAAREKSVEQDLAGRPFIWRECAGGLLPLGDSTKALPYEKLASSGFGQPRAEGDIVLDGGLLDGGGDFSVDRHGSLHDGHTRMVAPGVLPPVARPLRVYGRTGNLFHRPGV